MDELLNFFVPFFKIKTLDTVKTAKMYKFVGPSGKEATDEDPITLCKCISQKAFSSGRSTYKRLKVTIIKVTPTCSVTDHLQA